MLLTKINMNKLKSEDKTSKFNLLELDKKIAITISIVLFVGIVAITALLLRPISSTKTNSALSNTPENVVSTDSDKKLIAQPLKADEKQDAEKALIDFNQNPFDPETENPSDRFITFQIRQGQKYRMTINYANIGDEKMENGGLTIKLGPGLTLVKNSMKDDVSGKETQNIDDTNLYTVDTNIINYGPGSLNKTRSVVNPGQAGKITFDVEMSLDAKVGDTSRIYSYLSDEGDSKGKIDLVFFNITPKK
jgi:hypothetical protein